VVALFRIQNPRLCVRQNYVAGFWTPKLTNQSKVLRFTSVILLNTQFLQMLTVTFSWKRQ